MVNSVGPGYSASRVIKSFVEKVHENCRTLLNIACYLLCFASQRISSGGDMIYSLVKVKDTFHFLFLVLNQYWNMGLNQHYMPCNTWLVCSMLYILMPVWVIKVFGPRLLYNSVWRQCKSLGFLYLLIPNPFIPSPPHTALWIKRIEKGAGSMGEADSFSSCLVDDGQRLLRKPSTCQMQSSASPLCDALWCLCLCSTN